MHYRKSTNYEYLADIRTKGSASLPCILCEFLLDSRVEVTRQLLIGMETFQTKTVEENKVALFPYDLELSR
jgi:hypothetical protein